MILWVACMTMIHRVRRVREFGSLLSSATTLLGRGGKLEEEIIRVQALLQDETRSRALLQVRGEEAQLWLDSLQALSDLPEIDTPTRSSIFKMMLHLSKRSGLCPRCLTIKNVKRLGQHPVGGGGFGDVWKGKIGDQVVCLKVVKIYLASEVQKLLKEYMREAIVWQQLKHPNLLPFMGMYYLDKTQKQLCLVSPWMDQGNLVKFLEAAPKESINNFSLAYDVASGLAHLHEMKLVHGDLKGLNILITPELRACIGDFGLSRVADTYALRLSSSTSSHGRGTTRWLAPELLTPDPPSLPTSRSDMYAFGCVCYEIFARRMPFHNLTDGAVVVAVLINGSTPSRPDNISDAIWELMLSCWDPVPSKRPAATDALTQISQLSKEAGREIRDAPEWPLSNLSTIWKHVKNPVLDIGLLAQLQDNLIVQPKAVDQLASLTEVDSTSTVPQTGRTSSTSAQTPQYGSRLYQDCSYLMWFCLPFLRDFTPYLSLINSYTQSSLNFNVVYQAWDLFSYGTPLCFIHDLLHNSGVVQIKILELSVLRPEATLGQTRRRQIELIARFGSQLQTLTETIEGLEPFTADELLDRSSMNGLAKAARSVRLILESSYVPPHVWTESTPAIPPPDVAALSPFDSGPIERPSKPHTTLRKPPPTLSKHEV